MSYDPVDECHICGSKRVKSRWALCPRCQASFDRNKMPVTVWAAMRVRTFDHARDFNKRKIARSRSAKTIP